MCHVKYVKKLSNEELTTSFNRNSNNNRLPSSKIIKSKKMCFKSIKVLKKVVDIFKSEKMVVPVYIHVTVNGVSSKLGKSLFITPSKFKKSKPIFFSNGVTKFNVDEYIKSQQD